jgi:hypothetical protein
VRRIRSNFFISLDGVVESRLFPPDEPTVPLTLLSSETFETGVLNLSYAPADS